jgi:hypothetical protein
MAPPGPGAVFARTQAPPPEIQFQICLGGSSDDEAYAVQQTADGGYITAGFSCSDDGDVSGQHGECDFWVAKLNEGGSLEWQRALGGSGVDEAHSVRQTADGGYIAAGHSGSSDGDASENHGNRDFWLLKLTGAGKLEWQKALGGTGWEEARSAQQTADGGYIAAGFTNSSDGDVSGSHGSSDFWVVKLSKVGELEWQRALGGSGPDAARSVQQTTDGGYIVAGHSGSNDGDASENRGGSDFWVAKLSRGGSLEWERSLGGSGDDEANSVQQTADGGYIVAGHSQSSDGDVSKNRGRQDFWVAKLSSSGSLEWERPLGGSGGDAAFSAQQTADGGYIIAGESGSNDGDVSGNHELYDFWVAKLGPGGELEWQASLGGSYFDRAKSIHQTSDGGYIVAGESGSHDGDVSGGRGADDFWVVKLAPAEANGSPSVVRRGPQGGRPSSRGALLAAGHK